ncbi:AAA family ATPase CDC6 [Aspergillus aculeatinus CBS 121060]|uniref:Cell division control protein Cdc6 n=1 Tax=Aspergillus aculeatinus CBS 121060 TaxID=1448322 RepID=A0ACD1H5S9_9EURO|nr:putative cell division control protein Cdc6 [Aspergillus aculeatinus CBS 121060]RAH68967.1 putative cell division control protein Cdc6 [Aspergillus aculeatinus CBS 121060]
MAVSVLGKRQRGAIETEAPQLLLRSGSKRRAQPPRIREEPEPTALQTRQLRSRTIDNSIADPQENRSLKKLESSTDHTSDRSLRKNKIVSPVKLSPVKRNATTDPINDENSTPVEFKTPSKSRFRDALDSPPVTPKHRVQVGAKPSTPRTPRHATTPTTATTAQTVYTQARQLFARGASSTRIVGREAEREKLRDFIQDSLHTRTGGCLYVSGPPGTGKSALVQEVCNGMDLQSAKVTHINCASMRAARDVYSKLIEDLCDDSEVFKKSEADRLRMMFTSNKKQNDLYFVTLDEIDHLLTADAGILQSLFEWSLQSESKLMLIGIANALDLTDRSLPQLKAKNLKPRLLPFLPYNAAQIAGVITGRLRSLLPEGHSADPNFIPFVQPAAIQLCSKKVASQTGDLRKAFELIKRAIDLVEQETLQKLEKQDAASGTQNQTILVENNNLSSISKCSPPFQKSMKAYTPLTAPRASIAHVARITSSAFGQGTVQRLQGINLQQKAAICVLIALDRRRRETEIPGTPSKNKNVAPTVKQVYDAYCALCRKDNLLHPLTSTEFKDVLSNLETMGLVGEHQGRGRGGTVAGGTDIRRSPSKHGAGPMTPSRALDEQCLVCFVSQKEIESQIAGPGEGILRRLLLGQA